MKISIPKEIYYQDWIYVEKGGSIYDKYNTKLIDDNYSESEILIQFPFIVDDGYIYYGKRATNLDSDWYRTEFGKRRKITFNFSIDVLDDFNDGQNLSEWSDKL